MQVRTPRHLLTKLYSPVLTATAVLGPVVLVCAGPALGRFGVDPTVAVIVALDTLLVLLFAAAGLRFRAAERLAPV